MPETILRQFGGSRFGTRLSIDTDDPFTVHLARCILAIRDEASAGLSRRTPTEMRAALNHIVALCHDGLGGPGEPDSGQ